MTTEYRITLTATFATAAERDKAYVALKAAVATSIASTATFKRADMTKDEYNVQEEHITEKVI